MVFTAAELPKFTTHPATFIPTVFGGHVLVYESRSHPGHRREFAFKTRFTNQSGVSSCYYRCMSCRSMKNKVAVGPDGKPPQIPCIAVKNGYIVNDPDFPEANDHFCVPPTIEESKQREANGFAKAIVKGRPRQKNARGAKNGTATRRQQAATQLQAYQMANLINGAADSIFNFSNFANGFDLSTSLASTSAAALLQLSNGDFAANIAKLEGRSDEDNSKHDARPDEDDFDGTLNANRILASLISSEPALRSDMSVVPQRNALALPASLLSVKEDGFDGESHDNSKSSPESYTALVMNSLPKTENKADSENSASNLHSTPSSSGLTLTLTNGVNNGRKRKAKSVSLDSHLDEIFERYIVNNWELNENDENAVNIAELTCCLLLSLARRLPQIVASTKEGKWLKSDMLGEEISGKTLVVIGLGRTGIEVALRMQAFGLRIYGYDPLVSQQEAAKCGVKWLPLEQLWPIADYITVHVPLIPQTRNLISANTLAKCRKGVKIVNLTRRGVVNEAELLEALHKGRVGGAALDMSFEDPPMHRALIEHPNVICTPSLAAIATKRKRLSNDLADSIIALSNSTGPLGSHIFLRRPSFERLIGKPEQVFEALSEPLKYNVLFEVFEINATVATSVLNDAKTQWVRAAAVLVQILAAIADNPKTVTVRYPSSLSALQKALHAGAVVGLMHAYGDSGANLNSDEFTARKNGITVLEESCEAKELIIVAGMKSVSGYPAPSGTVISAFNSCKIPVALLAMGTLVVNLRDNQPFSLSDDLRAKMVVDYGLLTGTGRVALFGDLDSNEYQELCEKYCVVKFE